jgi:peptide deformylase
MIQSVESKKEGGRIARRLFTELERYRKRHKWLLGLSAPEIGIQKRVCIIWVVKPIVLMNPIITKHSEQKFPFDERCFSFPNSTFATWRYCWVQVNTMNTSPMTFGLTSFERNLSEQLTESLVVQHEIGHLYGKLATDFANENGNAEDSYIRFNGFDDGHRVCLGVS